MVKNIDEHKDINLHINDYTLFQQRSNHKNSNKVQEKLNLQPNNKQQSTKNSPNYQLTSLSNVHCQRIEVNKPKKQTPKQAK